MTTFLWSPEFSVGHSDIDFQHRRLMDSANTIAQLGDCEDRDIIATAIAEASDYIDEHFALEETTLRAAGYAELDRHIRQHDQIRGMVAEAMGDLDSINIHAVNEIMTAVMIHIIASDQTYAGCLA